MVLRPEDQGLIVTDAVFRRRQLVVGMADPDEAAGRGNHEERDQGQSNPCRHQGATT